MNRFFRAEHGDIRSFHPSDPQQVHPGKTAKTTADSAVFDGFYFQTSGINIIDANLLLLKNLGNLEFCKLMRTLICEMLMRDLNFRMPR